MTNANSPKNTAQIGCPVCEYPVPADGPTVIVDGREVRVCCAECAATLKKS